MLADVKDTGLTEQIDPVVYFSYLQVPSNLMFLLLRTGPPPEGLVSAVTREVQAIDRNQAISDVRTIDETLSDVIATPRFNSRLLGVFALLAVCLSVIGVYGATSQVVSQRTREIGTRMALGARPSDVLTMVLIETFRVAAVGVSLGIIAALAFSRALTGILYGIAPTDPATFAGTSLVLLIATVAAAYVPARRAAAVDPIESLKIAD